LALYPLDSNRTLRVFIVSYGPDLVSGYCHVHSEGLASLLVRVIGVFLSTEPFVSFVLQARGLRTLPVMRLDEARAKEESLLASATSVVAVRLLEFFFSCKD
jgi:hypothetical protein